MNLSKFPVYVQAAVFVWYWRCSAIWLPRPCSFFLKAEVIFAVGPGHRRFRSTVVLNNRATGWYR